MRVTILGLVMMAMIAMSSIASANRHYFLVGIRHIYKIPVYPDPHELDRQAIEETYSATIQKAQNQYDQDMNSIANEESQDGGKIHQADRDAVQLNIEQDTADAADQRDTSLSLIYVLDDQARVKHPELAVDQDGPYRVMAIDTNPSHVFVDVCYFKPYPLYVDVCPFGWAWGHYYPYATFSVAFRTWHANWISIGSPVFGGLCFGGRRVEVYMPVRRTVIINKAKWVGGKPPAITVKERENFQRRRDLQVQHGVIHVPSHAGTNPPRSKYTRVGSLGPVHRSSNPPRAGGGARTGGGVRTGGGARTGGGNNRGGSGNHGGGGSHGGDHRGHN